MKFNKFSLANEGILIILRGIFTLKRGIFRTHNGKLMDLIRGIPGKG